MLHPYKYERDQESFDKPIFIYSEAKKRKEFLKSEGWRIKITKGNYGSYEIWKKHVNILDEQRHNGNGRTIDSKVDYASRTYNIR